MTSGHDRLLHPLPSFYGYYTALWEAPRPAVAAAWSAFEGMVLTAGALVGLPPEMAAAFPGQLGLFVNDIHNVVGGSTYGKVDPAILVLLVFLLIMNGLAVYLRKPYERRWLGPGVCSRIPSGGGGRPQCRPRHHA